jgi:hypothetical protein
LLQRLAEEISATAVLLLHETGQVLHQFGSLGSGEFPAMAALVSAMIATGKSLGGLGPAFESPRRFACDSDDMGLYTVSVEEEIWLVALYDQPLNPGLARMKVRRCAEACSRLGTEVPEQGEIEAPAPAKALSSPVGATLPPSRQPDTLSQEKITGNSSLFTNITDDEIDRLFEDAHS